MHSGDPLVRSGLLSLLVEAPGLELVEDGEESDVVLVDLGLQPSRSLGAVRGRDETAPPVVALVSDEAAASEALAGGAAGVLPRTVGSEALGAALVAAARGLWVLAPPFQALLAGGTEPVAAPDEGELREPLTAREREVLTLLVEGRSNKAIAAALDISEHTAKFHVNAILSKLGVQRRVEAVVRAARLGIIDL